MIDLQLALANKEYVLLNCRLRNAPFVDVHFEDMEREAKWAKKCQAILQDYYKWRKETKDLKLLKWYAEEIKWYSKQLKEAQSVVDELLKQIPNWTHPDTPVDHRTFGELLKEKGIKPVDFMEQRK